LDDSHLWIIIRFIASHPFLRGHDVVIFQEAFSDSHRQRILDGLQDSYPYRTRILGSDRGVEQDGGVIIVSRWPIENCDQKIHLTLPPGQSGVPANACGGVRLLGQLVVEFPGEQVLFGGECHGIDCEADKGVLYARINIRGQRYHVFGTHIDADEGSSDIEARKRQLRIIQRFVNDLTASGIISINDPVIIGGDFNTELGSQEYLGTLLTELNVALPKVSEDHPSRIDYVFYSRDHKSPVASINDVLYIWDGRFGQLSDHDAILGSFDFSQLTLIPIVPLVPRR
jgi:hypothetical protein